MIRKVVLVLSVLLLVLAATSVQAQNSECPLYVGVENWLRDSRGDIYQVFPDGETKNVTETLGLDYNFFLQWEADGNFYMQSGKPKDWNLYLVHPGLNYELVRGIVGGGIAIDAEANRIAYEDQDELYIGDLNSELNDVQVDMGKYKRPYAYPSALLWYQGDLYFEYGIFESLIQTLMVYDLDNGELKELVKDVFTFSPLQQTSSGVGYVAYRTDAMYDYRVYNPETGDVTDIVQMYASLWQPSWNADYTKLAFAGNPDSGWNVFIFDKETTTVTQVTTGALTKDTPTWSPDGSVYVNFTGGGPREIARIDDGKPVVITDFGKTSRIIGFEPGCSS